METKLEYKNYNFKNEAGKLKDWQDYLDIKEALKIGQNIVNWTLIFGLDDITEKSLFANFCNAMEKLKIKYEKGELK